MTTRAETRILLTAVLAGLAPVGRSARTRSRAQFTTEMELPTMPSAAADAQAQPANGAPMTRAPHRSRQSGPAVTQQGDVRCKLDKMERHRGSVTWAMTCNSPQGPIHSGDTARYTGGTMAANLTASVPRPAGRITGRYLGPCDGR
jgi:hypothetical protein